MLGRPLILGALWALAVLFLFTVLELQWELTLAIFAVLMAGLSIEIAHSTTQTALHYGASGMVAGMMGRGQCRGGMSWAMGGLTVVMLLAGVALIVVGLRRSL